MNAITITGLIILIITLTIHFIFLNRNTVYKKQHPGTKSPIIPYVRVTGLLNLIGLIILIIGVFH